MVFLIGLIIVLVLILIILILGYVLFYKVKKFLGVSSFSNLVEQAKREDESIPKSLSSMDSLYLTRIKEDFPDLNINELKRECEKNILNYFHAIENKNSSDIDSDKIKSSVDKKIQELKDKKISFKKIKFHKTVVSKYESDGSVSTITFGSSLEYYLYENGKFMRKVQDRFRIQYIYILDSSNLDKYSKVLGIQCPNCGSPHIDFAALKKDHPDIYDKYIIPGKPHGMLIVSPKLTIGYDVKMALRKSEKAHGNPVADLAKPSAAVSESSGSVLPAQSAKSKADTANTPEEKSSKKDKKSIWEVFGIREASTTR